MKTFKIQYSIIVYGDKQALHMEYGCQHYSSETVLGGTQQWNCFCHFAIILTSTLFALNHRRELMDGHLLGELHYVAKKQ